MKKTLFLIALLLSILHIRCEELDDIYIHNPAGRWIYFTIQKGSHMPKPLIVSQINSGDTALILEFKFCFPDDSYIYDIGEDQSDWNKLFGVTPFLWGSIHEYSLRFSWRYYNNELQLGAYNYLNSPKPQKEIITVIKPKKVYDVQLIVMQGYASFELMNKKIEYKDDNIELYPVWYASLPYIGGNEPAQDDIHINIFCNQLIPAIQ